MADELAQARTIENISCGAALAHEFMQVRVFDMHARTDYAYPSLEKDSDTGLASCLRRRRAVMRKLNGFFNALVLRVLGSRAEGAERLAGAAPVRQLPLGLPSQLALGGWLKATCGETP